MNQFRDRTHKRIWWALMDTATYPANSNLRFRAWVDEYPETPWRGMTLVMQGASYEDCEILEMVSSNSARFLYYTMRTLYRSHRHQEMQQQTKQTRQ
jgi:hypothetical protein